MRAALQRWAIDRMLDAAQASLARAGTPQGVRDLISRAAPAIARREAFTTSEPFAIAEARGWWVEPAGQPRGGVILHFHGGGFVASARAIHDPLLASIGRAAGARGLMVDYRLAPEHVFPAATEDCFAAWNHLLSTGFDPGRVVFAGDSSGGNLALVTAMRARDEGLPLPAAIVLLSPLLDVTFSGGSFTRNDGIDPLFRAESARRIQDWYAPGLDLADPRISPLFGQTSGLPPTLLHVGSPELVLDDSLRYAAKTPGAEIAVWHGMPHVFQAIRGIPDGDRAIAEIADFIHAHTSAATHGA